jgi:hypothetical protein
LLRVFLAQTLCEKMSKITEMYGVRFVVKVELKIIIPKVWSHAVDRSVGTFSLL